MTIQDPKEGVTADDSLPDHGIRYRATRPIYLRTTQISHL